MIILATLLLAMGCCLLDWVAPAGADAPVFYLIPLAMSFRARQPWWPLALSGICTVLLAAGFFHSPATGGPGGSLAGRCGVLAVFWAARALLARNQRSIQKLQEKEQRFRAILEHSPLQMFVKDLQGRYVEFNRQCALDFGQSCENVLGKTDDAVFPKELSDQFLATDQATLQAGRVVQHQIKCAQDDGVHTLLVTKFPLFDARGRRDGVCGVATDITELKKAEQLIAFSNQRLRLIAQVTATVVGAAPLRQEGRRLAEQAVTAFGVDFCMIRTLEGENLALLVSAGIPEEYLLPAIPATSVVHRDIIRTRRPAFLPSARVHSAKMSYLSQLPQEYRFVSCAEAPLLVQDQVVGVLGIYWRTGLQAFSDTDLGHLQIVANHVAVAVANDRLFKEVRSQKDLLARQILERKRAEDALRQTTDQLQKLSRRLLEMQEAERRHIARELHDEIGQALTALKINLQAFQQFPGAGAFADRLLDSIGIVDIALRQVRRLSLNLRPSMLDDLGLPAALRWYLDQQAQRSGLRVQFVNQGQEERLDATLETTCFRIAQEAVTNIIRHAQAQMAWVELREEAGVLHLTVRDDGIGFDVDQMRRLAGGASMGLMGMEERVSLMGGRMELKSAPRQGTEVHAWFSLARPKPDSYPAIALAEK